MTTTPGLRPLIRVAVANGDPLRFVGLRTLLSSFADLELSCVDLSCVDPSEMTVWNNVDVVVLWNHAGRKVFDVMAGWRARDLKLPIVLIGTRMDDEAMYTAIISGAKGCVEEEAPAMEFARAFRAVCEGSVWVPRRVLSLLVERNNAAAGREPQPSRRGFTNREKQVLELLVDGCSNREIAGPLGIEERTVKAHVAKLMRKVGVRNRIALSMHAITHELISRT
jgi:DNA-binding NarL/FixJ family response regulator